MKIQTAAELFYTSMATVKAPATIVWYHKRIDPVVAFFYDREVEDIDLFDLESFRQTLDRESLAPGRNQKLTVYTIHGYVRAIRAFWNYLRKRKIIREDPALDLEKPRLPHQPRKGIAPENAEKMICQSKANVRDYAILLFIRDTACRAGGIYNLLTENIDFKHNKAIIREKGDKERTVFFTPVTTWALVMYASERKNPNKEDHFFLNEHTHEPLTYYGVYQIFRRLKQQLNIKGQFSPHQWRHATLRSLIMSGMNLKSVSEIAGHESVKITGDIYGTLNERELQNIYNASITQIKKEFFRSDTYPDPWQLAGPRI